MIESFSQSSVSFGGENETALEVLNSGVLTRLHSCTAIHVSFEVSLLKR